MQICITSPEKGNTEIVLGRLGVSLVHLDAPTLDEDPAGAKRLLTMMRMEKPKILIIDQKTLPGITTGAVALADTLKRECHTDVFALLNSIPPGQQTELGYAVTELWHLTARREFRNRPTLFLEKVQAFKKGIYQADTVERMVWAGGESPPASCREEIKARIKLGEVFVETDWDSIIRRVCLLLGYAPGFMSST